MPLSKNWAPGKLIKGMMPSLASLYVPGVLTLITFLALSSQLLYRYIEPGPLTLRQAAMLNSLLACLLVCYARACLTDPGRVPSGWSSDTHRRWCRKCEAWKPPRAHHCKECGRCITRMDHHCPWTVNCVSHRTFPHFMRFLVYSVTCLTFCEVYIWRRLAVLWEYRHWPAYHGPSHLQLAHLFLLFLINSFTLFALTLLLGRTIWGMGANMTTIEGWELERHQSLLRRARAKGGFVTGANGKRVRIARVEFPYDVGIWRNIAHGMSSANPLSWIWPFAATPAVDKGLDYETNDFNEPGVTWPPPDPDRIPMPKREAMEYEKQQVPDFSTEHEMAAFRARQAKDHERWESLAANDGLRRRRTSFDESQRIVELASSEEEEGEERSGTEEHESNTARPMPQPGQVTTVSGFTPGVVWRNSEGEQLRDFGVDESIDFYDEYGGKNEDDDTIPLGELIARRRHQK